MDYASTVFSDLNSEFVKTKAMLERVPFEHFNWQPHEKSWTLIQLATHIANLPRWIVMTIHEPGLDMSQPFPKRPAPASVEELLDLFDANMEAAVQAVEGAGIEDMQSHWALKNGNHEIWSRPSHEVVREFGITHTAHHRGQLSVYLRMLNIPLPPIYGPTADEQPRSE